MIEKECKKAVNRKWKRECLKHCGEEIDPYAPDTDPELKQLYKRIKRQIESKERDKIRLELEAKANEIANELPNLPKWIRNDPVIRGCLKNTKFLRVLNYTRIKGGLEQRWEKSMKWAKYFNIKSHAHFKKDGGEVINCFYIIVRVDPKKLGRYCGLSERSARKYLQALCKAGILIKVGKPAKDKPTLYTSGYYLPTVKGFNKIYWLKGSDNGKEKLCKLDLQF